MPELQFEGTQLHVVDFGGAGPAVLLLHGLAGHGREWAQTASWLTERCHVVALDTRGHGASERFPRDVSQRAHAADAAFVVEQLGLAPVVAVGHSLGTQAALLLAATRPELVRGLVVSEASPADELDDLEPLMASIEQSLRGRPVPSDGGRPRYDVDVMLATMRDAAATSYWPEWERIACSILIVSGSEGYLSEEYVAPMLARARDARAVVVAGAGHDVHLDNPDGWRRVLAGFLDSLSPDGREQQLGGDGLND